MPPASFVSDLELSRVHELVLEPEPVLGLAPAPVLGRELAPVLELVMLQRATSTLSASVEQMRPAVAELDFGMGSCMKEVALVRQ